MKIARHGLPSARLGQDLELRVYGEGGKPVLVFPTSLGRCDDFESFGMIEPLRRFIVDGELLVICVDSRDRESWFRPDRGPEMGAWHRRYELCIVDELVPFLTRSYGVHERLLATGCSWGGYHAANFALKFPLIFDASISLSAAYSLRSVIGDYDDDAVYFNDPLRYLPSLDDPALLAALREGYFVLCHGRGAWEEHGHEAAALAELLHRKGITCWYDVWGERYPHDWPSWREQLVKYVQVLRDGALFAGASDGRLRLVGPQRVQRPLGRPGST